MSYVTLHFLSFSNEQVTGLKGEKKRQSLRLPVFFFLHSSSVLLCLFPGPCVFLSCLLTVALWFALHFCIRLQFSWPASLLLCILGFGTSA